MLLGLGLLWPSGNPAAAAPLDKNACAKLAQDIQNMKLLEVDKLMEKGPQWAVSHLSPSDLALVRQYIDLDEEDEGEGGAKASEVAKKGQEAAAEASEQPKQKNAKAPKKIKQPSPSGSGDAH